MLLIIFIIILLIIVIFEYRDHVNKLPFHLYKLDDHSMLPGFKCIFKIQTKLTIEATYQYKDIQLKVYKQRFTPLNTIGTAEIYKKQKNVCNYSQLPYSFKTSLYKKYLQLKYPKSLSKIIKYNSKNETTKFKEFCKKENLITYKGE